MPERSRWFYISIYGWAN